MVAFGSPIIQPSLGPPRFVSRRLKTPSFLDTKEIGSRNNIKMNPLVVDVVER